MLAAYGGILFRLGLAVALSSYVMAGLLGALGLGVPRELAAASGLLGAVTGTGLLGVLGLAAAGGGFLAVVSAVFPFLKGRHVHLEVGRAQALAAYAALFAVSVDGIMVLTGLFLAFLSFLARPLAGGVWALVNVFRTVALVLIGFYMITRIFGVPAD